MADITLIWDTENQCAVWQVVNADLLAGGDLNSAVLISIFSDRRADPDDVIPDGSGDPRGWVGDDGEDVPIGSKVWLRVRSLQTQDTLNTVHDDLVQALQWFVDDGVTDQLDVVTEWTRPGILGAQITLTRNGNVLFSGKFGWLWREIAAGPPYVPPPVTPPPADDSGMLDYSDPLQSAFESVV